MLELASHLEARGIMLVTSRYAELAQTLWDELADFPVAHAEQVLHLLQERTCSVMEAQNACWIGAVRISGEFPEDPGAIRLVAGDTLG